jgi:hypothetical protein
MRQGDGYEWWIGKGLEWGRRGQLESINPAFTSKDLWTSHETLLPPPLRAADSLAEIQIKNLPNTILKPYYYTIQLRSM